MTAVFIGDIQGCDVSLRALLQRCEAQWGTCEFVMLGDLINRGIGSLNVLRLMIERQYASVIGNHELYLLAVHAGIMPRKNDTLDSVFAADDLENLIDWVRRLPLIIRREEGLLVHAGIIPSWSLERTTSYAAQIEDGLRGDDWGDFLGRNLGPNAPRSELATALAAFTRIRCLTTNGLLDHKFKGPPEQIPNDLRPWFGTYDGEAGTIFFGHWAALGARRLSHAVSLDSGCVWGKNLTAYAPAHDQFIHQTALE